METKIKFIEIKKEVLKDKQSIKVNDLTVKDDNSYTVSENNIIVHNCTTYPTTGFGSRNIQASVVHECSNVTKKPIIADGGIKSPADITKAIVLGSSMIMIGGMLSAFLDSPGRVVEIEGNKYKEFYGSASSRQGNKNSRIEGTIKLNKLKNVTTIEYLDYLTECLQSSISYGGGKKLSDLYSVRWI
jgi:GMP reductase